VIGLGILKELLAEIKRYNDDKKFNEQVYERIAPIGHAANSNSKELRTVPTMLQDIKVGDLLRLHDGQLVPADCVLVKIENANNEAFVKTVPLDGERNLKPKLSCRHLSDNYAKMFDLEGKLASPPLVVDCIKPIKDLYLFRGQMSFDFDG
jgi:magnesium-transporting ATPase (P-type)